MGGLNPFSKPKIPAPPPIPPAPKVKDVPQNVLTEERLRRQRSSGTAGNVVSSLGTALNDTEVSSRISKLLG